MQVFWKGVSGNTSFFSETNQPNLDPLDWMNSTQNKQKQGCISLALGQHRICAIFNIFLAYCGKKIMESCRMDLNVLKVATLILVTESIIKLLMFDKYLMSAKY